MKPSVVEALAADDKLRSDFLKACLMKLGLKVNQEEQAVPPLSPLHLSSMDESAISKILTNLQGSTTPLEGGIRLKCEQDTFDIERDLSAWAVGSMTKAVTGIGHNTESKDPDVASADAGIIDYDHVVKKVIAHENELPSAKETPYFNCQTYFENLDLYTDSTKHSVLTTAVGRNLMYAEVVTSTSTLLEKYNTNTLTLNRS